MIRCSVCRLPIGRPIDALAVVDVPAAQAASEGSVPWRVLHVACWSVDERTARSYAVRLDEVVADPQRRVARLRSKPWFARTDWGPVDAAVRRIEVVP